MSLHLWYYDLRQWCPLPGRDPEEGENMNIFEVTIFERNDSVKRYQCFRVPVLAFGKLILRPIENPTQEVQIEGWNEIRIRRVRPDEQV